MSATVSDTVPPLRLVRRRVLEFSRDLLSVVVNRILLRYFPALANLLYNALPYPALNLLVRHGVFRTPSRSFPWRLRLRNGNVLKVAVIPAEPFSVGYAFEYMWHDIGLKRLQEALLNCCGNETIYLDVGANIGTSSIYALSSGRKVWMFEPNPQLTPFVNSMFALNGFKPLRHENVALSDGPGEALFYVSKSSYLSSFDSAHASREGETVPVTVQRRTLDSYLPELKAAARRLIVKIDVEGHEMSVLRGARETLAHFRPPVMVEVLPGERARTEVFEFFVAHGYQCLGVEDNAHLRLHLLSDAQMMAGFCDINFLFTPVDTLESLRPHLVT